MAQFSTRRALSQNFSLAGGKNKLAGATPIEGNNTSTILYAFTLANAIAPPIIFALSSITLYSEDDFQQIFRTVLDFRPRQV